MPSRPIGRAVGRLQGKALVAVIVAADHHVGAERVEDAPGLLHVRVVAMLARAEDRVVPVRQGASSLAWGQVISDTQHTPVSCILTQS